MTRNQSGHFFIFRDISKALIVCQTEHNSYRVEVVLEFKKQQVGFDRLNMT